MRRKHTGRELHASEENVDKGEEGKTDYELPTSPVCQWNHHGCAMPSDGTIDFPDARRVYRNPPRGEMARSNGLRFRSLSRSRSVFLVIEPVFSLILVVVVIIGRSQVHCV